MAEGDVPARVRIELKDRIPAAANVRYAPFASLAPGMSVAVPSQPVKGLSPAKLAEAWASAPWVEGVVVEKQSDGATLRVYRGIPHLPWEFGAEVWIPASPDGGFGVVKNPSAMFGAPGKQNVPCVASAACAVRDLGGEVTGDNAKEVEDKSVKSIYYVVDDNDGKQWRIDTKAKARERVERVQGLLRLWKPDMIATHLPDMELDPTQLKARIVYVAAVSGAAGCVLTEEMSWFPGAHLIQNARPFVKGELFEKVLLGKWFFGMELDDRVRLSDFCNDKITWSTNVNAVEQFLIIANCCEMVQRFFGVLWASEFGGVMDPVIAFLRDAGGKLRLVPPIYVVSRIETALHRFSTAVFRDRISAEWQEQRKTVKGCVEILVQVLREAINTTAYEPFPHAVFFASKGEFEVLFKQRASAGRTERPGTVTQSQRQRDDTRPKSTTRSSGDKRPLDTKAEADSQKKRKENRAVPCLRFLAGFCEVTQKDSGERLKCERPSCHFTHSIEPLARMSLDQAITAIETYKFAAPWKPQLVEALKKRPQLFKQ